jgi:hypothetical protein
MKTAVPTILEQGRIVDSAYGTLPKHGFKGHFHVTTPEGAELKLIGHPNHHGREHVAVIAHDRLPTPDEMALVKSLFWDEAEAVSEPLVDEAMPFSLHLYRAITAMPGDIRQTIRATLDEWREGRETPGPSDYRTLETAIYLMLLAMEQSGAITINREGNSPEREVK